MAGSAKEEIQWKIDLALEMNYKYKQRLFTHLQSICWVLPKNMIEHPLNGIRVL